ncbi:MAG: DUF1501 domain-containing protein, partial [Anaerolineales bacterium]
MTTQLSRRDFLSLAGMAGVIGASKSLFPHWMPRLAFHAPDQSPPGDVLVCIFLRGGMDGISAVIPYADGANYYDARPTLAVPEPGRGANAAIDLDGSFGLHPALSPLKEIYDEGDFAIVHAAGSTDPSRSHFDAMQFMEYGTPGDKTTGTGWIGRHLQSAAWQNESPFRAVGIGAMVPNSLRGPVSPISLQSIADFHFRGRQDELNRLQQSLAQLYTIDAPVDALGEQAGLVFETINTLQSLNATGYQPSGGADYPPGEFGMGLQQVAQLVKAGMGLEVACLDLGGWDTHENQGTLEGTFNFLLDGLGRGLHAFYTDLGDRMGDITVVTMSEFGRRVKENGSYGTDHGHGNLMFLMGGGIAGGQVFASWPTLASNALDDGDLAITTDYRDVLAEVVSNRLLNPALD